MAAQSVNGDDLLYRFFRDLFVAEPELASRVPLLMAATLGVWLPLDVYREMPVLLPWVVRDPTCRPARATKERPAREDAWGAPNPQGFLRDDNSLVKGLVKSLDVVGSNGSLHGRRLGSGFVAAHIWRKVRSEELASRSPLLNTFVPNLVWLPKQVAKLSDLEGQEVQTALKQVAWAVYRDAPVAPQFEGIAEEAWSLLPEPAAIDRSAIIDQMNWFASSERFLQVRMDRLASVMDALNRLEAGQPLLRKVVCTRYTEGLPVVPSSARSDLLAWLTRFQ